MKLQTLSIFSLFTISLASPFPDPAPLPVTTITTAPAELTKDSAIVSPRQAELNAFLALLLDYLPAIDGTITAVSDILTTFEKFLAALTREQITYNELSGPCKPYTIIFARGTTEPGNVGILVGPPFFDAVRDKVGSGNVAIQGVNNYDASVEGYLEGGDPVGSAAMASQIKSAQSKCPNTKLIASGYSQGGQLVHNAISQLTAAEAGRISKVVIFGDPLSKKAIPNVAASKVKIYCHKGDNICEQNGQLILPPHLTYALDATNAAAFVAS